MTNIERHCDGDTPVYFLHIPRTAGLNFESILFDQFQMNRISPHQLIDDIFADTHAQFQGFDLYSGHIPYALMRRMLVRKPLTVTMLRDPIARFISYYAFIRTPRFQAEKQNQLIMGDELERVTRMSLAEFVEARDLRIMRGVQNEQCLMVCADGLPLDDPEAERFGQWLDPQGAPLSKPPTLSPSEVLAGALQNLPLLDFVGLTERFQESLDVLLYTFGWKAATMVRRVNASTNKPTDIDQATLNRIADFNRDDVTLYQAATALFDERYQQMSRELLERYGTRQQAALKLPLARETLLELLEQHYQARFRADHQPAVDVHYTFDQPLSGTSWHVREVKSDNRVVRWTGPEGHATLDFLLTPDADYMLQFCVQASLTKAVLDSLKVAINGHAIGTRVTLQADGSYLYEARIPKRDLADGFARLMLTVSQTVEVRSVQPDSIDPRKLGVVLTWIKFTRVA